MAFRPSASAFPLAVCIPPRPAPAARALFLPDTGMHSDFRIRALCLRSAATGDDDGPQLRGSPLRVCGVGLGVRLRLGLWRRQCIRRRLQDRVRGKAFELARRAATWLSRKYGSPLGIGRMKLQARLSAKRREMDWQISTWDKGHGVCADCWKKDKTQEREQNRVLAADGGARKVAVPAAGVASTADKGAAGAGTIASS